MANVFNSNLNLNHLSRLSRQLRLIAVLRYAGLLMALLLPLATSTLFAQSTRDLSGRHWRYDEPATLRFERKAEADQWRSSHRGDRYPVDRYVAPVGYQTPTVAPDLAAYDAWRYVGRADQLAYGPEPACRSGRCIVPVTAQWPNSQLPYGAQYGPAYGATPYAAGPYPAGFGPAPPSLAPPTKQPRPGRYIGLNFLGQRTVYKEGEPVRNFFRAVLP